MEEMMKTPQAQRDLGVGPGDTLQVGGDDDIAGIAFHKKVNGTPQSNATFVIVAAGKDERNLAVGGKTLIFPEWTETVFVLEEDLLDVAKNESDYEIRFAFGSDLAGTPGAAARALIGDTDALIFRGAQNPSWSASSNPGGDSLGTTGHRVLVTLASGDEEIDRIDWYNMSAARVWSSGAPGSPEAFTRGAAGGSGWYTAGGTFTSIARGDIES